MNQSPLSNNGAEGFNSAYNRQQMGTQDVVQTLEGKKNDCYDFVIWNDDNTMNSNEYSYFVISLCVQYNEEKMYFQNTISYWTILYFSFWPGVKSVCRAGNERVCGQEPGPKRQPRMALRRNEKMCS